nr:hypothetical protein [Tanacetum cinerariifolium]
HQHPTVQNSYGTPRESQSESGEAMPARRSKRPQKGRRRKDGFHTQYDTALTWHLQFINSHGETVTWDVYEEAVLKRFGFVNADPMAELKNLMHGSSMKDYQSNFERLLNLVDITELQSISIFIAGLPAAIELNVRMFRPRSLSDAFSLASLQKATLAVIKQKNTLLLPTPRPASNWNANRNTNYALRLLLPLWLCMSQTHRL